MSTIDMEAQLIEKAVDERNQLIDRAKERAERLLQNAKNEEERINSDVERHMSTIVGSEIRAVHDRIVGRVNLEGRRDLMGAKMELIEDVFAKAQNQLIQLAESGTNDYNVVLKKLIIEAGHAIGGENLVVSSNKRDQEHVKSILLDISKELEGVKLELDITPIDTIGGVIVRNRNGTKTYYNTLEGRLMRVRNSKESEVAEKLGVA
jgi:V/A-type H+-transporting ATPase subunit E